MKSLQKLLLGLTFGVSGFGAEFKLPENFLVFDPSRVFAAITAAGANAVRLPLPPPKAGIDTCAHIRLITPPSDLDPGIALPGRTYAQSKMPILKTAPACEDQVR